MKQLLLSIPDKAIQYSFYLLFFLVPLILTPLNYELFEYNKMMLIYIFTVVITGGWIIKMTINKEIKISRTPLDLPLLLFLLSQVISTFFSIDRHVSLFGYYSRFNGGLLSTISYILLYYAFVTNFPKEKIKKLLFFTLSSGLLVSLYGILEHLGIDKDLWVQDVQNRVFSTLGQPNWLAAYLSVLIPITIGIGLTKLSNQISGFKNKIQNSKFKIQNENVNILNIGLLGYWVIGLLFYLTLLFTKSRSGFIGLWISLIVFWSIWLILPLINKIQAQKRSQMQAIAYIGDQTNKLIGIFIISFIAITFFIGSPFPQINRFTFPQLFKKVNLQPTTYNLQPTKPIGSSVIDVGITESGTIRGIVWKGALAIFKHYPLFGSGVETFAFSYYKFRPIEHNMTSEWDFLYNKAHNEYLNYAATTGIFGLGSYLLIIGGFIWWNLKNIKNTIQNSKSFALCTLHFALFAGFTSILITNFFGFSVVVIQLFFFLIPAISFTFARAALANGSTINPSTPLRASNYQLAIIVFILFFIFYILYFIFRLWYADTIFASGYHAGKASEFTTAYQQLKKAASLNPSEPLYYDEFSIPAAFLALAFDEEKQATLSSQFRDEAILASDIAVSTSPNNVNFWKTRTRVFYALSQIDEKYLQNASESLEKAKILSPTDPKISYNLGLLYDKLGKNKEAIGEIRQATRLKLDYRDAYYALAFLYDKNKQKKEAGESLNFILTRINPNDEEAKKKLEELK